MLWVVVGAILLTFFSCIGFLIYCFVTAPLVDDDGHLIP